MPSKQKTRRRPDIVHIQMDRKPRHEHQLCGTPGCKNVIAVWTNKRLCAWCRMETR
jgi:hypothetical protein